MKKLFPAILLALYCTCANAQDVYFVDGYHGGIYGHYPVDWKTRFITDKLAEHPEWRICLEIEPETWDTVKVRTPEDYDRFRKIAGNKRIEFTNPAYAQPYCYNISGESIIRQFGYGIRKVREHFPEAEFTTYSVEEPCFTSGLPQILKLFGFKYAVLKCPGTCWGGYMTPYGGELVNWTGPDGTRILTVPRYACEELEANSVWQTKAWANSKEYLEACRGYGIEHPVGMCFQDAGWKNGPWIGSGQNIKNNSIYTTWKEYIEDITGGATSNDYKMSQEDVRVSLMWGSQVLQKIARQVREAENRMIMAEKIGAMANIATGYRYQQKVVDEAWRTLMLAQHHDSWIVPYNRLNKKRTWAQEIEHWTTATNMACDSIIAAAQNSFDSGVKPVGDECYIRIYNTLGVRRREPVTVLLPEQYGTDNVKIYDTGGRVVESHAENIPGVAPFNTQTGVDNSTHPTLSANTAGPAKLTFEADVPPFGYTTYRVRQNGEKAVPAAPNRDVNGNEYVMENSMYRMVIDASKGSIISSLIAKQDNGKEFADTLSDYSLGELRGFFYDEGRFISSTEQPAVITVLKDNKFEKSVAISGHIGEHPFTQTITLSEGRKDIDFDLRIDWKGNPGIGEFKQKDAFNNNRRAFYDDRFKLNVLFPVSLKTPTLYKDAPFDVCESRQKDTHFKTWDSIKHNVILHWVDLAEEDGGHGFALLSDHTTSYSYGDDFPLGLTAQYSGGGLWGMNYGISGPLQMRYAVIPHTGKWDAAGIHSENMRRNEPLTYSIHSFAEPENVSLIDVGMSGYEISAVYTTDKGIVVRLFNANGDASPQKVKFGFPLSEIAEIDLNGNIICKNKLRKKRGGHEISIEMPRFGIKTLFLSK